MDLLRHYRGLVDEYKSLVAELQGVHEVELRARLNVYQAQVNPKSAAALNTDMDMQTIDIHIDVIELNTRIKQCEVEIQWCRDLLEYGIVEWSQDG